MGEGEYPREFSISSNVNCEAGLAAGVHYYRSDSDFFCFSHVFFNETSWRLVVDRKKLRLDLS